MADTYAYIYQLQNQSYSTLSNTNFKIAVTDPDDTGLTSSQISSLHASDKTLLSYLSIGEAEDYRSYWQSSWNSNPPSFIIKENPDWPGNYQVRFWDPAWQKIIIDRAVTMAKTGYDGLVLDVVDVYNESAVAKAYGGDARAAMMNFVIKIADAAHAINPDFKIIQNNAHDLLVTNPDDPNSATNTSYLSHIDGVNAETTWYMPDNSKTTWGAWNEAYLKHAVDAGKDVFAIDYPTGSSAQQDFINKAIADGFIPYVGNPALSSVPAVNSTILAKLPADSLDSITGHSDGSTPPVVDAAILNGTSAVDTLNGTSADETIYGFKGSDTINGGGGHDTIYGGDGGDRITGSAGNDHVYGGNGNDKFVYGVGSGNDVIHDFQGAGSTGGDVIYLSKQIYSTKAQIMSHVTYSGNDAVIQLDGANKITVLGVGDHGLSTVDFQFA